jgi:hypothetical protein
MKLLLMMKKMKKEKSHSKSIHLNKARKKLKNISKIKILQILIQQKKTKVLIILM